MKNFCLTGLLLLLAGCRVHTLEDGPYTFTLGEVLRDDCGLASTGGVLTTGTLRTEGNLVSLNLAQPNLRLVGTYRFSLEEMTLDGTLSNFQTTLRGQACLLDTVALHLDTTTLSPTAFEGSMSISYEARTPDACVCKFWFKFSAQRQ